MPNDKKKMQKPAPKKPSSKLLGSGTAKQAADALTEREKKLRRMMKELDM